MKALEARGFSVMLNWHPPTGKHVTAGEVDLICARDSLVLVTEVKSTFVRKSQRDAWLHATTTLRRAGQQLQRKVAAVLGALAQGNELASLLGLESPGRSPPIHGWIVDTSIERDHERFSGFLKLSLEEILIALRDDRALLGDPNGIFSGADVEYTYPGTSTADALSLYPSGFTGEQLIAVIEAEAVWDSI